MYLRRPASVGVYEYVRGMNKRALLNNSPYCIHMD